MTPRDRFVNSLTFQPVDRVFNMELGLWGQTYERWYGEGMPRHVLYGDWFSGEEYFGLDQREFIPINMGMIPGFDYEVLEEDERTLTFRGGDGVVHKALKEAPSGGRGLRWTNTFASRWRPAKTFWTWRGATIPTCRSATPRGGLRG